MGPAGVEKVTILRVGSNEKYAAGWEQAFGKKKTKSAAKATAAKAKKKKKAVKKAKKKAKS